MVADGQYGCKERLSCCRFAVYGVESVAEEEMVAHAERVDNLALGVALLRVDVVVAVGCEECLHVVILCLVGHEEHVVVIVLL